MTDERRKLRKEYKEKFGVDGYAYGYCLYSQDYARTLESDLIAARDYARTLESDLIAARADSDRLAEVAQMTDDMMTLSRAKGRENERF